MDAVAVPLVQTLAFPTLVLLVAVPFLAAGFCGCFSPCFWTLQKWRSFTAAVMGAKKQVTGWWGKRRQRRQQSKIDQLQKELDTLQTRCAALSSCLASQNNKALLKFDFIVSASSTFDSEKVQSLSRHSHGNPMGESHAVITRLNARLNGSGLLTLTAVSHNTQSKVLNDLNEAQTRGIIKDLNVSQDCFNFQQNIDVGRIMVALRFAADVQTVNFVLSWVQEVPPPTSGFVQSLSLVFNKEHDVQTNALLIVGCKWKKRLGRYPAVINTFMATFDIPAWVHQNDSNLNSERKD